MILRSEKPIGRVLKYNEKLNKYVKK